MGEGAHDIRKSDAGGEALRLELSGITKAIYPSVVANDDVSLKVKRGEIHAVLGENGAGKSTLMKMIYGVTRPDAGEMKWEGETSSTSRTRRMPAASVSAWCSSTSRCSKP